MLDLRRSGYGVRELVRRLEQSVIDLCAGCGIAAHRREGMPGVYVADAKLAAVGLRVSRGCTFHGIALNVNPELGAFAGINPCGYPGLQATRLADLGAGDNGRRSRWESTPAALYPPSRIHDRYPRTCRQLDARRKTARIPTGRSAETLKPEGIRVRWRR
jgi:hypothetical protein